MADKNWTGTTFGNKWMHKMLICSLRFIDVHFLYIFSYLFIIPLCLLFRESRKTAYSFYRERLNQSRLKAAWSTYVNHCVFAEIVIDKFAMYAGKRYKVVIDGGEIFDNLNNSNDSFIILSSHIGNYEIAGYSLLSDKKRINAVVYAHEKQSIKINRQNMFDKNNIQMISIMEDMSHLFLINSAIGNGEIISFPADRFTGKTKYLICNLFGAPAKFPKGPFSVATLHGLKTLSVNVMKDKWTRYHIYIKMIDYDENASRQGQINQLINGYAACIEQSLVQYPLQWFNFYDFWA